MKSEDILIKAISIEQFSLRNFYKLKNIQRKNINTDGVIYVGDKFECDLEMARYLNGNNEECKNVIKILEVKRIDDNKKI